MNAASILSDFFPTAGSCKVTVTVETQVLGPNADTTDEWDWCSDVNYQQAELTSLCGTYEGGANRHRWETLLGVPGTPPNRGHPRSNLTRYTNHLSGSTPSCPGDPVLTLSLSQSPAILLRKHVLVTCIHDLILSVTPQNS